MRTLLAITLGFGLAGVVVNLVTFLLVGVGLIPENENFTLNLSVLFGASVIMVAVSAAGFLLSNQLERIEQRL